MTISAYEMWAWGCHVYVVSPVFLNVPLNRCSYPRSNIWENTWEVCKRVDRSNFGLCLDTFQIAGTYVIAHARCYCAD